MGFMIKHLHHTWKGVSTAYFPPPNRESSPSRFGSTLLQCSPCRTTSIKNQSLKPSSYRDPLIGESGGHYTEL
ncbi:hypothetical protein K439DRAFT_1636745 [Ramaria rubella]|nr:hypothetical protein K439DRAFT_1636745 [Ramaria rubella]